MEKTNFWSSVRAHNINLLASQIRANGGTCNNNAESIIENIGFLAETGESYGEEKKFLRLDVRRAIGSLCDTGRIIFRPVQTLFSEDKKVCTVGGYLYEVRENGTEITVSSYAVGGAVLEDVYSQEMMSDAKRSASLLALASARAESNAYFNAGIGIEFKGGEVFNLEAIEAQVPAPEPVMPTPTPAEAKKRGRKPKTESAPVTEPAPVSEPTPVSEPAPTTEAAPVTEPAPVTDSAPVAESTPIAEPVPATEGITYEEALKEIIDVGNYKGKTIGEVLEKEQTARNIPWCLKQEVPGRSERLKEALVKAIEGYQGGRLKMFLNR